MGNLNSARFSVGVLTTEDLEPRTGTRQGEESRRKKRTKAVREWEKSQGDKENENKQIMKENIGKGELGVTSERPFTRKKSQQRGQGKQAEMGDALVYV